MSLAASILTFRGHCGARPGGWRWQEVLLPSLQPPSCTQAPGLRDHRKATSGCATLLACPEVPRLLDWARPCLPRTTGASRGGPGSTVKGARGASPHHSRPVSVPLGLSSPSPTSRQCHHPQGATSPTACPLVPVALPCGVAPSPPGAGFAYPPLPSTHSPGRFFADF